MKVRTLEDFRAYLETLVGADEVFEVRFFTESENAEPWGAVLLNVTEHIASCWDFVDELFAIDAMSVGCDDSMQLLLAKHPCLDIWRRGERVQVSNSPFALSHYRP